MHNTKYIILVLMMLMFGLLACITSGSEKAVPTPIPTSTTLPPFLTTTPRVTATLTPSNTPTPSDTPTSTITPTPITPTATFTLTATPPIVFPVISNQNVNVRRDPSFSSPVLTSVEPGTEVEIHGASQDQQWIKVRLIDEDGRLVDGWINEPLVDLGDYLPPTVGPTATPSPTGQATTPSGSPVAFVTVTPSGSGTPLPQATPGEELSDENVLAYCRTVDEDPPDISADETVSVYWSWFVRRPELMENHLAQAQYEVLLDGRLLTNYQNFETPIRRESDGNWYVYWYVPVGRLPAGRHEVTYRLTWAAPVNDGFEDFVPGTPNEVNEGNCVFTVSE